MNLSLNVFLTRAIENDFAIPLRTGMDLVLTDNVLKGLQRAGAW